MNDAHASPRRLSLWVLPIALAAMACSLLAAPSAGASIHRTKTPRIRVVPATIRAGAEPRVIGTGLRSRGHYQLLLCVVPGGSDRFIHCDHSTTVPVKAGPHGHFTKRYGVIDTLETNIGSQQCSALSEPARCSVDLFPRGSRRSVAGYYIDVRNPGPGSFGDKLNP